MFLIERVPLKRWILNWSLSFLTQTLISPKPIGFDIQCLQALHVLSFAAYYRSKIPVQVSICLTAIKLGISTQHSLSNVHNPLRILVGLGLASMGYAEMTPTWQHYFAMLFFWTFCDTNLYRVQ